MRPRNVDPPCVSSWSSDDLFLLIALWSGCCKGSIPELFLLDAAENPRAYPSQGFCEADVITLTYVDEGTQRSYTACPRSFN